MGEWKAGLDKKGVGKKGRSGRKSVGEEIAKREAVIKAWNKINNEIDQNPVDKVALPIALKTMTDKSEMTVITPKPLLYELYSNNSDQKDSKDEQENQDSAGRDISE